MCELVRELLGELAGLRILDLAAGPGRLLTTICAGKATGPIQAIEPNPRYREWLRLRLLCHGRPDVGVGESLAPNAPPADLVVVDPPFQPGEHDRAEEHPLVWAHRATHQLIPDGISFAVVPEWTLTRNSATRRLPVVRSREDLVRGGCLRAIIQLPRHLHPARAGTDFALLVLGSAGGFGPTSVVVCDASAIRSLWPDDWITRTARLVGRSLSGYADQSCRPVPSPSC